MCFCRCGGRRRPVLLLLLLFAFKFIVFDFLEDFLLFEFLLSSFLGGLGDVLLAFGVSGFGLSGSSQT